MRAVIPLLLFAGTAAADPLPTIDSTHPPTLRVTAPEVRAVSLALRGGDDPSWLHVDTTGRRGSPVTITLDVPTGTHVVGFGLTDLDDSLVWARPEDAIAARHDHGLDRRAPALVEASGSDHVTISLSQPGSFDLALVLPDVKRVTVEAAPRAKVSVTGTLAPPSEAALATTHVDPDVSLFASIQSNRLIIIDSWGPGPQRSHFAGDKSTLRKVVRLREPALLHCYMREAQRDASLRDRQVVLHLGIWNGAIDAVTLENVPDSVAPCFEAEIKTWEFVAEDGYVLANYPIEIKVND